MSTKRATKAVPLRIPEALAVRVEAIAAANGISPADAYRICLAMGLPRVERGEINPSQPLPEEQEVAP